ncbi:MAG: TetR/AcrR family transcriptional regulator [Oscillospiraceae bacterium]|nr:TetR/AcrR family transcriptional regulator [Oscillospiraceae bacterium]
MPIRSPELNAQRREQIMAACLALYGKKSFREIAMRDIAEATTFSRPSIYNYFETKEEIFLALSQREYEQWTADLNEIVQQNEALDIAGFADAAAKTVERRILLLKLLSMNMYDMEENSRAERLTEFKTVYGASMDALSNGLKKFFPDMTETQRGDFLMCFMAFMYGIYPYAFVTDKQNEAMKNAGMSFQPLTVYEMTYNMIVRLLSSNKAE